MTNIFQDIHYNPYNSAHIISMDTCQLFQWLFKLQYYSFFFGYPWLQHVVDDIKPLPENRPKGCPITICIARLGTIYLYAYYLVVILKGVLADTCNAPGCPHGKHISTQEAVVHTVHRVLNKYSRQGTTWLRRRPMYAVENHTCIKKNVQNKIIIRKKSTNCFQQLVEFFSKYDFIFKYLFVFYILYFCVRLAQYNESLVSIVKTAKAPVNH